MLEKAKGIRGLSFARIPVLPLLIVFGVVVCALAAPWLVRHSPIQASLKDALTPPFWMDGGSFQYPLGTDALGRDILSRLIYGARVSLIVAVSGTLIAGTLGVSLGMIAGYFGGTADMIIMRLADMVFALPLILLALVLAILVGPSLTNVILIIAMLLWAQYARQVRAEVLSIRERDYVALGKIAGSSGIRIMFRHIFPNVINTVIVLATLQVGTLIILEASLSFLGVGIPPPDPSWGSMVSDGRDLVGSAWWVALVPGVAMVLTILSLNVLGDWARDRLDPKLRQI